MIFLTVGTQFPFDRLIRTIDEMAGDGVIHEPVFAQIGDSRYIPKNIESIQSLEKSHFDETVRQSSVIISHAGMGSITMAFEYHKPLLVMPRLARYKEVVNDHQVGIARKFAEAGYLLAAMAENELPAKIQQLKTFIPKPRINQADQVTARIKQFLDSL